MVLIYEMIKSSVFFRYKFTPQILSLCKNKNSLLGIPPPIPILIKNITKFPFSFPFPLRTRRIRIRMMHNKCNHPNSTTTSVDALQQVIHTTQTHTHGTATPTIISILIINERVPSHLSSFYCFYYLED